MWQTLQCVGGLLNKNRTKIIVASVVAVGVAVYMNYNSDPEEQADDTAVIESRTQPIRLLSEARSDKAANRSRLLLKMKSQFDQTANQFLPTLRVKIVEVVDISGTVRHIKELRRNATSNQEDLEARLWSEIKNASFTMLLVTAYMLSAVCTLLKIQLHILARSLEHTLEQEDGEMQLDSSKFRALIEGTYRQLFGSGLRTFTDMVKSRVEKDLAGWSVKEKLHVEFDELHEMLTSVRINLEADMEGMIKTIFIPAEAEASAAGQSPSAESTVQGLLDQTWDLLESPAFGTVYREAVDTCFRHVYDTLYKSIFAPHLMQADGVSQSQSPSAARALRAPPLASLLPQIKAIASNLLPTVGAVSGGSANGEVGEGGKEETFGLVSAEVKEISSGPYLESFCIAILDTVI